MSLRRLLGRISFEKSVALFGKGSYASAVDATSRRRNGIELLSFV
jgi:hypothetical protein